MLRGRAMSKPKVSGGMWFGGGGRERGSLESFFVIRLDTRHSLVEVHLFLFLVLCVTSIYFLNQIIFCGWSVVIKDDVYVWGIA